MASITVSVPEPLGEWVEARVESGGFESVGAYLRGLIDRDQEDERERELLNAALAAGEASGLSDRTVLDIVASLKREHDGTRE